MKKLLCIAVLAIAALTMDLPCTPNTLNVYGVKEAEATIRYINGYTRSNGTSVSGHYRDTSNDGNSWNNANTLGYND